ncbi:MAG: 2-hydroxyacyl-CoA dehydratase [Deltaproteobacteria bacterium]|nr:2-hydroxyacyl-CoA dehydratase [Deltaproteobacteria bacterium]
MPAATPIPIPSRIQTIREHHEAGGKVAAVYPIHYPRALFRAFGVLPVEVWGPPSADRNPAGAHLQVYVCSIVHCGLGFLLSGGLDIADLIVVPHACDSLQGLGSLLLDFQPPKQPVQPFYVPRGEGTAATDFLVEELRALYAFLAEHTGAAPSDAEVMACIEREERAGAAVVSLFAERRALPLDNRAFYRVVRSREFLPAERFLDLCEATLASRTEPDNRAVPVVLSGIVPEPMEVLDALSEAGAMVVADDLACCGRRMYPAGSSTDPFRRMAERLLGSPPDCTRGTTVRARLDHLRRLVEESGARAVVFYEPKFCEPEQFYLPLQRDALEADGIHTITIEVDIGDPLGMQAVTRIEALLETVV